MTVDNPPGAGTAWRWCSRADRDRRGLGPLPRGLALLLRDAGHEVAAAVGDAPTLIEAVAREAPDLAVVDIRMPPRNEDDGAQAAAEIRSRHPGVAVMLLSQHVETRHSLDLVAAGGFGYLLKDRVLDVDDFLDALRRVAAGGSALDPEVVAALVAGRRDDPLAALSPRERRVWPDGRGPHQRGHRAAPVAHRPHRRDPRAQHPRKARPAGLGRGSPARAGRPRLSARRRGAGLRATT